MRKIVLKDRRLKLPEKMETVKIFKEAVRNIFYNILHIIKIYGRWVPRLLRFELKLKEKLFQIARNPD